MLLGIWNNIADLEEKLNLAELEIILDASRKKEHNQNRFLAALKGIDIDKDAADSAKERFDAIQNRVEAKLRGVSQESIEMDIFGLEVEIEE